MGLGLPSWDDVKDAGGDLVDVVNEGGELLEDGIDRGAELLGEGVETLSHIAEDGLDAVGLETAADWVRKHGDELADRLGAEVGEMQLGETDDPKQLVALAPPKPEFLDRRVADLSDLRAMADWHSAHFTMGFLKGTAGLVQFVRAVNPTDPYNLTHPAEYTTAVSNLAAGLVHGTQHPGALVNALIGEGWTTDPAEALGRLAPDVLLALATDGAGLAAKADDLARAADDLGRVGDDLARAGDDAADLRRLDDDLRELVDKPVDELTADEIRQLREARDAITVEAGTPMQRVITPQDVEDYLRGASDNPRFRPNETFGYTARQEDVSHLQTPQEMFDGLGLDYEKTPYRAPGDPLGPNQGGTAVDEMHVLRYRTTDPDDVVIPRDSSLGGDGTFDRQARSPDDPFTGNGYTSGGIPEFRTQRASTLEEGSEIWRVDASGHERLVAVLKDGLWQAVAR